MKRDLAGDNCESVHGESSIVRVEEAADRVEDVNLPTKFEVSNSTHYEDMKGDTKCRTWGGLGQLGSLKVTGNSTSR